MKLLIIGAGATGTVLGYFARQAGADVTFLVKEKYASKLREGITLHQHRTFRAEPFTFELRGYDVQSELSAIQDRTFDAIFSTVPSNALSEGTWLAEIGAAFPGVTFVSFQPGLEDRRLILEKTGMAPELLVEGSIPFLSYLAPMPGETHLSPGYAFWIPPTSKGYFDGDPARAQRIVRLLTDGGYPAKFRPKYKEESLALETLLSVLVIGLEKADWSFDKLFNSDKLYIVSKATEEAFPLVYRKRMNVLPERSVFRDLLFRGIVIQSTLRLIEFLAPFDLEQFFQIHYTKIDVQRRREFESIVGLKPRESLGTSLTLLRSKS